MMNKKTSLFITLLVIAILVLTGVVSAHAASSDYIVHFYFFRGEGCPHCADEEEFLKTMIDQYGDQLNIHEYEVWQHPENVPVLEKFAAAYSFEPSGVPVTFIGNQYWVGFSAEKQAEIEKAIADGAANGVVDAQEIVNGSANLTPPVKATETKITIPLIGQVDLSHQSLLISTIIIGLVDGINPCSLWVLTMLLAMIVHTNSRKKTLAIGIIFLTVTALIYALFITGVFTILNYMSYLKWIQLIVAAITLVLGLINLKDYFFFKEGVSLSIDDQKKPGLYQKMRNVMNHSDNFWAMAGATVILGVGVSLVEFSCTAAFPVVWSNLLVANNASRTTFIALLILYMILYQLDEFVIFGVAVATMKTSRMQEKHGQMLKLFSGCLMVVLSLVMLIKPSLMNSLASTLVIFAAAVAITAVILLLAEKVLPRYGIQIGHRREPVGKQKKTHTQKK